MSQDKPVLSSIEIEQMCETIIGLNGWFTRKRCETLRDLALSALDRQGWISVEERLPEGDGIFVWIYGLHDLQTTARFTSYNRPAFRAYVEEVERWEYDLTDKVTHWMPLPRPPHNDHEPPQAGQDIRTAPSDEGHAAGPAVERRKDNWTLINERESPRIGRFFKDSDGREFHFFGIVNGYDDYYYGMFSDEHGLQLLSCVGAIEGSTGHGWTEIPSKSMEDEQRERYEAAIARREKKNEHKASGPASGSPDEGKK